MVCVEKRQCGGGGTPVKNSNGSEEASTWLRKWGDSEKHEDGRLSIQLRERMEASPGAARRSDGDKEEGAEQ